MSDREGAAGLRASAAISTAAGLIAIFVLSRLVLLVVALLVEANVTLPVGASASSAPILRSLTVSDSAWYIGIANSGYHVAALHGPFHDYVFFPLFPLVVRAASILTGGDLAVAGVLVANVAFGLAIVAFERMSRPILGPRGSLVATALLAFAPGAVSFAMAYTDSLFLLLSLLAVLAARRGSYAVMGGLFALAALTRLPGVVLIVPLAIVIGERDSWRPRGARRPWLWLLGGPIALAGFLLYLWALTGDALAYPRAQDAWNHPPDTLAPPGFPSVPTSVIIVAIIAVAGFYLFQLVYLRTSRLPRADVAYMLAGLVALAFTARIVSLPRYLAVLWPFPWLLTSRRSALFQAVALAGFVMAFAGFAYLNFTTLVAA